MKKILLFLMIAVMLFTVVSCNDDELPPNEPPAVTTTTTTTTTTTAPQTPDPTPDTGNNNGNQNDGGSDQTPAPSGKILFSGMTADAERVTAQINPTDKKKVMMIVRSDVFSQTGEEVTVVLTIKNEYDSARTLSGSVTNSDSAFTLAQNLPASYVLAAGETVDVTVTVTCVTALSTDKKLVVSLNLVEDGENVSLALEGKQTEGSSDPNWTIPY